MATTVLLTAEDLAEIPEERRGELIDGVMQPVAPIAESHWDVGGRILIRVGSFAEQHGLGRTGGERGYLLRTNPDTVLAPDISFVSTERMAHGDTRAFTAMAPDLVVEVMSPANTPPEMLRRTAIYLEAGVRLVWIVDPATRLLVAHTPEGVSRTFGPDDVVDGGDVLPGFTLALADLFA